MNLKELGAYLRRPGTRDRLRIEARPWYDSASDDPHFQRWLTTGAVEVDSQWQAWLDGIRANIADGTMIRRVRIVADRQLNDYLRFEMTVQFPLNAAAGEQIRVLTVPHSADVDNIVDHFVIDGERVAISHYDDGGRFQYATAVENRDEVVATVHAAEQMWQTATPFTNWLARQRRLAA